MKNDLNILKLGITGHRDMVETKDLREGVKEYFIELNNNYNLELLSPLADGADRFIAKLFLKHTDGKLIVPMPFSKQRYLEDFSDDSKNEFMRFLEDSENVFEVDKKTENGYLDVGRYVVDNSDILIAVWDFKDIGKVGGSSDIVKYSKGRKPIIEFKCDRES